MSRLLRSLTARAAAFLAALCFLMQSTLAHAQQSGGGINLARDAETERDLRALLQPILKAANIPDQALGIYIVADPQLNAFVAEGRNVFINFGLFLETDNVSEVQGVLAHEMGHITGGHLARASDNAAAAGKVALAGLVLAAAAIAAGAGGAGMGLLGLAQNAGMRTYLSYSRVQEASADQAGAGFLEKAGISGRGMIGVFNKFKDEEYINQVRQDPYVRSHPLNSDRIAAIEPRIERSSAYNTPPDPAFEEMYRRIKAKVTGYALEPRLTLQQYPESDKSIYGRYARVYAYNKLHRIEDAISTARSLTEERPDDPWFQELLAQVLFENGRTAEAIPPLRKAAALVPDEPLLLTSLGQALSAQEKPATDAQARDVLEDSARRDPENGFTWFLLAIVANRLKEPGLMHLANAERLMLGNEFPAARYHAEQSLKALKKNTPQWFRANDIVYQARAGMDKTGSRH